MICVYARFDDQNTFIDIIWNQIENNTNLNHDKRNIRILFDIEYLNNLYLMNINEQF